MTAITRTWSEYGFWHYSCGCIVYQDGSERCALHVRSMPTVDEEPRCRECGATIGAGSYCFEHKPYLVTPKKDGTFLVDRYGRRHVSFDEPPLACTMQVLAAQFGWTNMSDAEIYEFICERERLLRIVQAELETHKSNARTAEDALRERLIERFHRADPTVCPVVEDGCQCALTRGHEGRHIGPGME